MATEITYTEQITSVSAQSPMSWMQRLILRRSHPRSLFINSAGFIWFIYYFWQHNWQMAIVAVVVARIFGYLSVMDADAQALSETKLGKIALLHLHPMNLLIQVLGFAFLLYGVWLHSVELTLGGTSAVLIGHVFGWSKVDKRFT